MLTIIRHTSNCIYLEILNDKFKQVHAAREHHVEALHQDEVYFDTP